MRRLAWTLGLATARVPRQPTQQHTRRTVQQKANIFEQAADAASKFFEERARQDVATPERARSSCFRDAAGTPRRPGRRAHRPV